MIQVGDIVYKINPHIGTTWPGLCHKRGINPLDGYKVTKVEVNYSGQYGAVDPQNPILLRLEGFNRRMSANKFSKYSKGFILEEML